MLRDMCVDVKMEEGYMRMSIEYNNDASKRAIQDAISKVEKDTGVFPSVIRRSVSQTAGNFSVEFEYDSCQRTAGDFYELVIKELGIDNCQA